MDLCLVFEGNAIVRLFFEPFLVLWKPQGDWPVTNYFGGSPPSLAIEVLVMLIRLINITRHVFKYVAHVFSRYRLMNKSNTL